MEINRFEYFSNLGVVLVNMRVTMSQNKKIPSQFYYDLPSEMAQCFRKVILPRLNWFINIFPSDLSKHCDSEIVLVRGPGSRR